MKILSRTQGQVAVHTMEETLGRGTEEPFAAEDFHTSLFQLQIIPKVIQYIYI